MGTSRAALVILVFCACGPSVKHNGDDTGGDGGNLSHDDKDMDGYSPADGDCDDADPNRHPGALEDCMDGIDNDCNGDVDHADYQCLSSCEKAAHDRSSVGCVYYGVDTNTLGGPYALAISNIDPNVTANVVIEAKSGGTWAPVPGGTFTVMPHDIKTLVPARHAVDGSVIAAGAAYRVTSDTPVIAYQFAPIDGSASFLSDASLLLPTSSLDKFYIASAWPYGADIGNTPRPAHIQIAASAHASVTVTSPIATLAGSGVPALQPNVPQTFTLEEGDVLQLTVATLNQSFTGAYIESDAPVALFSSNDCANVPNIPADCCCDHLEEQIFGLQTWGKSYVAAQMPKRGAEGSVWQITAQQDGTNVTFSPAPGVTGLPPSVTLGARQTMEYTVTGGSTGPGDFLVDADKPVLVNQYTVGSFLVQANGSTGDPDMVQAIPTEQFLAHYTVLIPSTWVNDFLVIVRKAGMQVMVDGIVPNATWHPLGAFETTVIPAADGIHTLDGAAPFGVSVSGYDEYDSYSYPGGLNQTVINPIF